MPELVEQSLHCPYCDAVQTFLIETLDERQEYIEDCQICCQPILFRVDPGADGLPRVSLRPEDETF